MMRIIISGEAKIELERLEFDISTSIRRVLTYVKPDDTHGLSEIRVTDLPTARGVEEKALGCYFAKAADSEPYVEIYFKNLFGHLKTPESLRTMLPIEELGLARTLYHEIGHHARSIRTHGIKRKNEENFTIRYAMSIWNRFILDNAQSINSCFENLKRIAKARGLSLDVLKRMELGWKRDYKKARRTRKAD